MKWFKNIKIRTKLLLSFSITIILMIIIGLNGFLSVKRIQRNLDDIFAIRLPSIDYIIEADRDLQQLLVAERSMIFSDVSSDVFKELLNEYETNLKQSNERWEKYKAIATSPEEKELISKYEKAREEWKSISGKIVEGRKSDTREGRNLALDLSLGTGKKMFEEMRSYLDKLTEVNLEAAKRASEAASLTYRRTIISLFSVMGIGLITGLILALGISRSVGKSLNRVIKGLTESSSRVASASSQVSSASKSLAEGASEQAAGIEETSSSMEEMASMTRKNAENANQANLLMTETSKVVEEASLSMEELKNSMGDITAASEETAKIIKTIDEIAFQTNLLALNAAVEAARAGEAGTGFAVVADEVRNLAVRAAEAAKNTAGLIETTLRKVKSGSEVVVKANEAFLRVVTGSKKVGELVGEIAAASQEQAQGIEQINRAISEMDRVVQRNSASAEESASAAVEMSAQAEQLRDFVSELLLMVEGRKNGNGFEVNLESVSSELKHKIDNENGKKRERKITNKVSNILLKKPKPEDIIPMEEGSFKDF